MIPQSFASDKPKWLIDWLLDDDIQRLPSLDIVHPYGWQFNFLFDIVLSPIILQNSSRERSFFQNIRNWFFLIIKFGSRFQHVLQLVKRSLKILNIIISNQGSNKRILLVLYPFKNLINLLVCLYNSHRIWWFNWIF